MKNGQLFRARVLRTLGVVALLTGVLGLISGVMAQTSYPTQPIKLVVPFAPGGSTDSVARLLATDLGKRLGQSVIVENRPGAAGNIAADFIARSEPDGYTLFFINDGVMTLNPFVYPSMGFDAQTDFTSIAKVGDLPCVLVANLSAPFNNLKEMIAYSKTKPEGLNMAIPGLGTPEQLISTTIVQGTDAKITIVPYKGGGPVMTDVMAGHVPLAMASVASATPLIKGGQVKPIAISSPESWPSLPQVPTMVSGGVSEGVLLQSLGLVAPRNLPQPIVDKLNSAVNATINVPEIKDRIVDLGVRITPGTPQAYDAELKKAYARFGPMIKAANIKVD